MKTRCIYAWHRTFLLRYCLLTQDKFPELPPPEGGRPSSVQTRGLGVQRVKHPLLPLTTYKHCYHWHDTRTVVLRQQSAADRELCANNRATRHMHGNSLLYVDVVCPPEATIATPPPLACSFCGQIGPRHSVPEVKIPRPPASSRSRITGSQPRDFRWRRDPFSEGGARVPRSP